MKDVIDFLMNKKPLPFWKACLIFLTIGALILGEAIYMGFDVYWRYFAK